ncbi:hypothetical protein HDU67_004835 [Dinochytrium kinnereticum]|nr:hypothetical protein HDU67_004835 [Dinochytrium kinnereticum]
MSASNNAHSAQDILLATLERSDRFFERHPAPVATNRLRTLLKLPSSDHPLSPADASSMIRSSCTLAHDAVVRRLIPGFIAHKKRYGSKVEKSLYESITPRQLLKRLMTARPLAFYGRHDKTMLRSGITPKKASAQWHQVGTEKEGADIHLNQYLSYHEMQLSALIGASVPTRFINAGDRKNHGVMGLSGTFTESGIYVGLVGPRFNGALTSMESEYLLVSKDFSTEANGFGKGGRAKNPAAADRLALLADLFVGDGYSVGTMMPSSPAKPAGTVHFPTFEEVAEFVVTNPGTEKYLELSSNTFLNVDAYKRRVAITAETLLLEANERAAAAFKDSLSSMGVKPIETSDDSTTPIVARVIVIGFGLGVWMKDARQISFFVKAFEDVIRGTPLPHVGEIVFSWIAGQDSLSGLPSGSIMCGAAGNDIRVEFSNGNPADLPQDMQLVLNGRKVRRLLVASFAWDGNSYPGNEYWFGQKSGSGDSAAACCSLIGELMNPEVNPVVVETLRVMERVQQDRKVSVNLDDQK